MASLQPIGEPEGEPPVLTLLPGSTDSGDNASPAHVPKTTQPSRTLSMTIWDNASPAHVPTTTHPSRTLSMKISSPAVKKKGAMLAGPDRDTHQLHIGAGPGGVVRDLEAEKAAKEARNKAKKIGPDKSRGTMAQRIEAGEAIDSWELFKYKAQKVMLGVPMTVFMLVLTLWALYGTDIQAMSAPKSSDGSYEVIAILLFVIFMMELIINALTQEKYFGSFFFWLDFIAAVSMLLDVSVIKDAVFGDGEQDLTVARAGRAARAGTRAGRLLKMTRLLRVIKLFRTVNKDRTAEAGKVEERADSLGARVAELTTNKVVCGVLIMLVAFPMLSVVVSDTGPSFALKGLSKTFDPAKCAASLCTNAVSTTHTRARTHL